MLSKKKYLYFAHRIMRGPVACSKKSRYGVSNGLIELTRFSICLGTVCVLRFTAGADVVFILLKLSARILERTK